MSDRDRIMRTDECEHMTGLSESTIWRLEQQGEFPQRRRISKHAIGWLESEIQKWIRGRAKAPENQETRHTAV